MSRFGSQIPPIASVQRANFCVLALLCALLLFSSKQLALACLAGGLLAALNLLALSAFVHALIKAATRRASPSLWVAVAPLKLFALVALAYLVVWRLKLEPLGFAIGISSPFLAAIVATARLFIHSARSTEGLNA